MDILGNSSMRQIITDYYQASDEPKYVRQAINAAVVNESKRSGSITRNTFTRQFSFAMYGARKYVDRQTRSKGIVECQILNHA